MALCPIESVSCGLMERKEICKWNYNMIAREGDVVIVKIGIGPLDGEVRCFDDGPPEHRW